MSLWRKSKRPLCVAGVLLLVYVAIVGLIAWQQRAMLYFPSHGEVATALQEWTHDGRLQGYCREVSKPNTVWLMMHGNAGQAANRDYVLEHLSKDDALYVLEYPGYGRREGSPRRESFHQAAAEAYGILRSQYSHTPVCVLGESLGSGPACALAQENPPPEKIVLITPFDTLAGVAARKFPILPVRFLLQDDWDNKESLRGYEGDVDIFAAASDEVIPIQHARELADAVPQARFIEIPGRHNDWSFNPNVEIRR